MDRIFHSTEAEWIHILLKSTENTPMIDCMWGQKLNLYKFKKIILTSHISSDHNGMKQEIKNIQKTAKSINMWRLKICSWIPNESKKKPMGKKKSCDKWKCKHNTPKLIE